MNSLPTPKLQMSTETSELPHSPAQEALPTGPTTVTAAGNVRSMSLLNMGTGNSAGELPSR
jgi:hypothetical protein